jgi:cyclophilin family peptidyl-prolyl cis-trans isomerase
MTKKFIIRTNYGSITLELDYENAPVTCRNFEHYVNKNFFDGTIFHRVIKGFMIQGGGMTSDMSQKSTDTPIILESENGLKNYRGTIAMARTMDPNSATSQFFINHADNDFLNFAPGNPGYAVFGKVIEGMEVVDAIAEVETASKGYHQDVPMQTIKIETVLLHE